MSEYMIVPKDSIDDTADAIKTKLGTQNDLTWGQDGFASYVDNIESSAVWTRPDDWPNLDNLDISGNNVLYMTYMADENNGYCYLKCQTSAGQYTVEVGHLSGNTFVADDSYSFNSNSECRLYFGSVNGGYKVVRVTASNLTSLDLYSNGLGQYGTKYFWNSNQGLLEVRGKATYLTVAKFYNVQFVQRVYIYGGNFTGSMGSWFRTPSLILCELPYCVTENTTDCGMMFWEAFKLKGVDITGWDTKNVTKMNSMFYTCRSLEQMDLRGLNTSNVTSFDGLFQNCSALKSVNMASLNVKKVTSMKNAFSGCSSLQSVDISGWQTNAIETTESMFNGCANLKSIDVSDFDTADVTNMLSMFSGCRALDGVDISDWDMGAVTNSNDLFLACSNIQASIIIPASLAVIGSRMFTNARRTIEFHFERTTPPTLSNTNAFANMTDAGGKKIYVPYSADHSVLNAYKTETNWSTYADYIFEESP